MPFKVTAPLVVVRDQNGRNHHTYRGGYVPFLDDEQRPHFLRHGLVEEIEGPMPVESVPTAPPPVDALIEKPKKTAPKGDWVSFGISKGNAPGELEAMSKEELIDFLDEF
jgi:hypothetical protein